MSDEADRIMDREASRYDDHIVGDCDENCPYCFTEELYRDRLTKEMDDLGD